MGAFRKKFFNSHNVDQQARRDTKFSFSFLLVARFAFFARANVILIARLSALLCEFARHFFLSFHAKLLLPRPEGTPNLSSSFSFLSLPLPLLGEFVPGWPGAKRKFSPVLLFVVDSTLLGLSPTVVSCVGVCFIIGSWSKWMLGVLVTMMLNPRSLARFSDEWAA